MSFSNNKIVSLAAGSLFVLGAVAQNGFNVINNLQQDIYYELSEGSSATVYGSGVISAGGSGFSGGYQPWGSIGEAISVKLDLDGTFSSTNIFQFEFNSNSDGNVWYDLSAENGDPLVQWSRVVVPSYNYQQNSCTVISCDAGEDDCDYTPYNPQYNPNYPCPQDDGNGNGLGLTLTIN